MDIQEAQANLNKAAMEWYKNHRVVHSSLIEKGLGEACYGFELASQALDAEIEHSEDSDLSHSLTLFYLEEQERTALRIANSLGERFGLSLAEKDNLAIETLGILTERDEHEESVEPRPACPTVVCLCGSTRFKEAFDEANYQETMAGRIVLSVGFFMHATGNRHGEEIGVTPEQKIALDELHFRKIELANEILVLNVGGYIGYSTSREIAHAKKLGRVIRYLEPLTQPEGG